MTINLLWPGFTSRRRVSRGARILIHSTNIQRDQGIHLGAVGEVIRIDKPLAQTGLGSAGKADRNNEFGEIR